MKLFNRMLLKFALFISGLVLVLTAQASELSAAGYWKTISDRTHKPASIMQLWIDNGELKGKVVKIFRQDNNKPTDLCKHCKGERYNQPIQGMTILWGMRQNKNGVWKGGVILDPKIGKTYHCVIKVANGGKQLNVRGYIGLPLIGRTQNWYRVSAP